MTSHALWIGTYTAESAPTGTGAGIHRVVYDAATGSFGAPTVAAETPSASWLARHPNGRTLWAVEEAMAGAVHAFSISDGELSRAAAVTVPSIGTAPCHLLFAGDGQRLVVSNYGDGVVTDVALADSGLPLLSGAPAQADEVTDQALHAPILAGFGHRGSGPVTDRQEGPHAHSSALAPGGDYVLVADLGTDELRGYRVVRADGTAHLAAAGPVAKLPPGSGPRHIAVHNDGYLYVTGELDCAVHVLRWDPAAATATHIASVPAWSGGGSSEGAGWPAHLIISPDQRRLWVSTRGPDVIATFEISDDGAQLTWLADTPVGGQVPRHFAHVPGALIVANQASGTVTALPIGDDGVPAAPVAEVAIGTPVCVLPTGAGE